MNPSSRCGQASLMITQPFASTVYQGPLTVRCDIAAGLRALPPDWRVRELQCCSNVSLLPNPDNSTQIILIVVVDTKRQLSFIAVSLDCTGLTVPTYSFDVESSSCGLESGLNAKASKNGSESQRTLHTLLISHPALSRHHIYSPVSIMYQVDG
jgi:hypothetical protein